jgi:hypothetical protein
LLWAECQVLKSSFCGVCGSVGSRTRQVSILSGATIKSPDAWSQKFLHCDVNYVGSLRSGNHGRNGTGGHQAAMIDSPIVGFLCKSQQEPEIQNDQNVVGSDQVVSDRTRSMRARVHRNKKTICTGPAMFAVCQYSSRDAET